MQFTELSPDQLAAVTQAANATESYADILRQFVASGIQGADVSADFGDKKLTTVAAGLKNAAKKHSIPVTVVHLNRNGNDVVALVRNAE